jgi:hypothetical protein
MSRTKTHHHDEIEKGMRKVTVHQKTIHEGIAEAEAAAKKKTKKEINNATTNK